MEKIYGLADIYHSDNIDWVSDDFIEEAGYSVIWRLFYRFRP